MIRYYRDEFGNYGETTAEELPESVEELTEQEYRDGIAALIEADEERAAAEEAQREAERQAREEAAAQQRERERQEAEARQRAEAYRRAMIDYYYGHVVSGDMSLQNVPEEYRWEVESRLNPTPTIEERVDKLENPAIESYSTVKYLPENSWVSVMSHQVSKGSYYLSTEVGSFRAYNKGKIISETNPILLTEDGVLSIQVMSETAGDYIIKLTKI